MRRISAISGGSRPLSATTLVRLSRRRAIRRRCLAYRSEVSRNHAPGTMLASMACWACWACCQWVPPKTVPTSENDSARNTHGADTSAHTRAAQGRSVAHKGGTEQRLAGRVRTSKGRQHHPKHAMLPKDAKDHPSKGCCMPPATPPWWTACPSENSDCGRWPRAPALPGVESHRAGGSRISLAAPCAQRTGPGRPEGGNSCACACRGETASERRGVHRGAHTSAFPPAWRRTVLVFGMFGACMVG